ncbi:hypothetical protein ACH4T9_15770 [Micromonospora sp. NPDC020750]
MNGPWTATDLRLDDAELLPLAEGALGPEGGRRGAAGEDGDRSATLR